MKLLGSTIFITLVISFLFSSGLAQTSQNDRLIITMSESEIMELDFRREFYFRNRLEFNITSESEIESVLDSVSGKLTTIGWTSNWQQVREDDANWHTADFFALGGANLRLELNETSSNNYRLLLYRY